MTTVFQHPGLRNYPPQGAGPAKEGIGDGDGSVQVHPDPETQIDTAKVFAV